MLNLFNRINEESVAIVNSMNSVSTLISEKFSIDQEDGSFIAQDFIDIILKSFMIGVASAPKILNYQYYIENKQTMFTGLVSVANSVVYNIVERYELTPIFSLEQEKTCSDAGLTSASLQYLCLEALVKRLESLDFERANATLH